MPELYGKSLRARIAKRYAGSMSESQTMPETSEKGLTAAEVAALTESGQVNAVKSSTSRSFADIVRANVFTLFNGIIFAAKAVLTGNKMEQKYYRTHSGWVGGLKETKYRILMQEKPELAMRVAVRGMMPRNTVTKDSLKRLHIYAGEAHEQQAQKPEVWEVK